MEALKKQRSVVKSSITRVKTFVLANENVTNIDVSEYETREVFLGKSYQDYCRIQENIESIDESEEADRGEVELKYLSILAKVKAKIRQLNQLSAASSQHFSTQLASEPAILQISARLPSVNIPTFSGKIEDWQAFIDLFLAIIDSHSSLSDVQKFLYLKGALAGEALNLINNLPLTNDNYTQALDLLRNRFQNKLVVINSHLKGMLDTPHFAKGTGKQLRVFLTHIRQHVNSLKALKLPVKEWDVLLVFLFSQKLDYQTHRAYELEKNIGQTSLSAQPVLPTLDDFLSFLENRCVALENIEVESSKGFNNQGNKDRYGDKYVKNTFLSQEQGSSGMGQKSKCNFCNRDNHYIHKCFKFANLSLADKRQFIQLNRLCYNCLGKSHGVTQCQIKQGCRTCNRRHHTLLHDDRSSNAGGGTQQNKGSSHSSENHCSNEQFTSPSQDQGNTFLGTNEDEFIGISHGTNLGISREENQIQKTVMTCSRDLNSQVLLCTAMLKINLENGQKVHARALLDSGSQTSFITKELFKKLGNCESYNTMLQIGGISNKTTQVETMVKLTLESHINNYTLSTKFAVLDKITSKLPHVWVDLDKVKIDKNIKLADPFYYRPGRIDMLISADLYGQIVLPEVIKLGTGLPVLQNSELGWLVFGTAPITHHGNDLLCHMGCTTVDFIRDDQSVDIDELIPKFWQMEELQNKTFLSGDEKLCEQLFLQSCTRLENGGFQVDLPMRSNDDYLKLGNSFHSAYKRFQFLEAKFGKNPQLFADYKKFIDEYVELNHGKYVECNSEAIQRKVFLAHHCVIKKEAISTKLRVVFDASSKTSTGVSLNDIMLKGSTVQPELFDILMRFRMFQFVLVSDIKKMYRMIKINPQQLFLQNILWRECLHDSIKVIELQTVTYGTKAAPFLATRCLNKLATDEMSNYPLAAHAILNQCYVDDVLCGANSKNEVIELKKQLISMLHSGGFSLHKWLSNDLSVLGSGADNQNAEFNVCNEDGKVLGIVWHPIEDKFKIRVPQNDITAKRITKRLVLSRISQMFDPMGYVCPVIVMAKILMQEIWMLKLLWDDELPANLTEKWRKFSSNLSELCNLKISRWVFESKKINEIQIHGFSDASMAAYGACVYIRAIYADHSVSCNLLCSKSRIAPIKTISLPRLELCGALLLSQLVHRVLPVLKLKIDKVCLWTDSSIVLCWLKGPPNRWTTFVANRIAEMQELTSNFTWNHVGSKENPADCISRGISVSEIIDKDLWWHGPQFLQEFNIEFANKIQIDVLSLPEQKEKVVMTQTVVQHVIKWDNFSNFLRLHRAVAYCHHFIKRGSGSISIDELKQAHHTIMKQIQLESFEKEIKHLQSTGHLQAVFKESHLKCLNPFIDKDGILRINGRLANAKMDFNQKFPIILPSNHYAVKLLIRYEHLKLFHAGPQAVLANLRLRYWIIHGMGKVKSVLNECVICHKLKAKGATQLMGCLPADRISIARPFQKVGIDFGGPLTIKQSRLRGTVTSKAYIALFVCMVTKAIHIEVVSSLSTEAFIHTLRRFIARRGCPLTIYSDNATNFQGANNVLRDVYLFFKNQQNLTEINNSLINREIEWRFIPPVSPHWGGLWEAGIKSTKFHLRRIVGNLTLTFEELTTVLAQIEAILNSRPLCPVSSDPSDLNCLTPAHFLIGEPLTSIPEKDVSSMPENRLSFFQLCLKIKQNFWKRWSTEYLTRLQSRPKWFKSAENLKENTMVLLKEDNIPPLHWSLGRIIKVMPGSEGRVRVLKIKTKDGIFTRPIGKVSPLPFDTNT